MPQREEQTLTLSEPPIPACSPGPKKPDFYSLVSLFPKAKPGYVPLRVRRSKGSESSWEKTRFWYGAEDTVIFLSNFLTQFGEILVLRHPTLLGDSRGVVIGLHYCESGVGVAVRFLDAPPKWMPKS